MEEFTKDQTSFWGVLAASLWFGSSVFKYLATKASKKESCPIMVTDLGEKMSEVKRDIHNLKEVVTFGFTALKAGKDIFSGGFHPEKLGALLPVYTAAVPAFENFSDVIPEAQDLDAEEIAELSAHVISQGAVSEEAARIVSKSLKVASSIYELIKEIKD